MDRPIVNQQLLLVESMLGQSLYMIVHHVKQSFLLDNVMIFTL